MSNSTDGYSGPGEPYDPTAPVPHWHQNMELATICIANSLTLLIIIARIWVRRIKLKRFKPDDLWIAVAGVLLIFPHWVCQLGTNRYGSGLHSYNLPNSWIIPYWKFSWGWVGYYLVTSLIKVSMCFCLLEILPYAFRNLRLLVYSLCVAILSLGFSETCVWLFQCQPFISNFVYSVWPTYCVNVDAARFAWVGVSVSIDLVIIAIPFAILRRVSLKPHERIALMLVFGAGMLGTITCLIGIYGIWINRNGQAYSDLTYTDTVFVMLNDIEILMYTVGASATVVSKYLISKAAKLATYTSSLRSRSGSKGRGLPSWRRGGGTWENIENSNSTADSVQIDVARGAIPGGDHELIEGVTPQNSGSRDMCTEKGGVVQVQQNEQYCKKIPGRELLAQPTRSEMQRGTMTSHVTSGRTKWYDTSDESEDIEKGRSKG